MIGDVCLLDFIGALIAGMTLAPPPLKAITSAWSDNPYLQI
jgi:hypothetical protein